ncbi:type II toxin-antitoxin system mRNA interferase toxin, RelE/StbE family [Dolichospermum sp. UHCC 0259]|uniref:type II toxin-antitoxin system RelE/ParE family toxin n=1 Tax=Dolichospermum sp. UHCC 0259 TaxID=2590010 RepID=UPI0014471042|nr:type II toxin-antitoxin system mRNA interferase toxin, RelE/StbE family [Dolichospermum sp. UHCC 0259]MTJ47175.1 type II toxin-antitoxin system mRNA interferase toxin, RelE/StbE family [Dolichospermum sp. UHCC 0259]
MKLVKDDDYTRKESKLFKKRPHLVDKYGEVLEKLKIDPFDPSLKTHKLKGELSEFYSCSLTYEYRIVCVFLLQDETIILVNIGSHDEVY